MKKLLFYGGAFNPPHLGHERLLSFAIDEIKPDVVVVAPSCVSPHKENAAVPFYDRLYMCKTFIRCGENVRASGIELGGKHQKSYTLKTVKRLKKRYPEHEIFILIGSDMLLSFDEWHLYKRLLSEVTLAVACREDEDEEAFEAAAKAYEKLGAKIVTLTLSPFEISSTEVRKKISSGESTKGLVSEFTEEYIRRKGLYR